MPRRISLTEYVDFVSRTGLAKVRRVREMQRPYRPAQDYYKAIREFIIEVERRGRDVREIQTFADEYPTPKKADNYGRVAAGYRKWRSRVKGKWVQPRSADWSHGDLMVNVNPEIGLVVARRPHFIKLYFKAEGLPRNASAVILAMMSDALHDSDDERPPTMAVLDVQRGRLHSGSSATEVGALLRGEALNLLTIWNSLEEAANA